MIEAQKNEEAVIMISELAKLLRVSLSRGKTIIPVKDELQHSRSYMNIQLMRYKERFQMELLYCKISHSADSRKCNLLRRGKYG